MKLFGGKRSSHTSGASGKRASSKAHSSTKAKAASNGRRLTGLQRGLLLLLAALLVLCGVVFVVYRAVVKPPDVAGPSVSGDSSGGSGGTNKLTAYDEETGEEVEIECEAPGSHKEGYYNILILGTDDDGTRTDTIMIARMNAADHTVALMSIPRDTLINASYSVPKINSVYGMNGKGEKGVEALKKQLTAILGFDVDGYVLVNLKAFVKTVDLVGGVPFNVPQKMYYNDPTQDLYINLSAGEQVLDGEHAMQLVRYRKYAEADIQRTKVQQDFLKALAKKCLSFGSVTKIKPMIEIFAEYVDTDLTFGNMVYFAQELLKCDFDHMETYTLPGQGVNIHGGSYYGLFAKQVLEIVNKSFNPYDADIPLGNLHIRGSSGGSSTGGSSSGSSGSSGGSGGHSGSSSGPSSSGTGTTTKPTETTEGSSGTETPETPGATEAPTESGGTTQTPETPTTPETPPETPTQPVVPVEPDGGNSNGSSILDPSAGTTTPEASGTATTQPTA